MHAHPLTSSSGRDGAIQSLNVPIGSKPLPRTWIGFPGSLCVCRLIFTPLKLQPEYLQGVLLLDGGLCFAAFTCTVFDFTASPDPHQLSVAPNSVIAEVPVPIRLRSVVSRRSACIAGVKSKQTKPISSVKPSKSPLMARQPSTDAHHRTTPPPYHTPQPGEWRMRSGHSGGIEMSLF